MENDVERTAEQGEEEDQEDKGELERAFFIATRQKMPRGKEADCHHQIVEPTKLLIMHDGGDNDRDLYQDQRADHQPFE